MIITISGVQNTVHILGANGLWQTNKFHTTDFHIFSAYNFSHNSAIHNTHTVREMFSCGTG